MITNDYKLPDSLFKALSKERRPPVPKRISATDLIDAPLQRVLKMKYLSEISEDASTRLWSLLGQAVHYIVEKQGGEFAEIKKEYQHPSGATLVTIGDYYKDNILIDWKITSTFSFVLGEKQAWNKQLHVVKYIYAKHGMKVDEMYVYAILRDWMQSKVYDEGYPEIPFQQVKIKIWSDEELDTYIDTQVQAHLDAEKLIDTPELIPVCTEEERWTRPTTYAVTKKDAKRATRVLPTQEEAEKYIKDNRLANVTIEERQGKNVKCESYCSIASFCPFFPKQETV